MLRQSQLEQEVHMDPGDHKHSVKIQKSLFRYIVILRGKIFKA